MRLYCLHTKSGCRSCLLIGVAGNLQLEATSLLDIPSERLVQEALLTILAGRTAMIIAHRLSTVAIADRVLVLDHGRIIEDGSPDELMSADGEYSSLHASWQESLA